MGFNDRFLIPYYFLFVLLSIPILNSLYATFRKSRHVILLNALLFASIIALFAMQARGIKPVSAFVNSAIISDASDDGRRTKLGILLSNLPSDLVIATGEVGTIAWFSGLRTIDIGGLTDQFLTHHPFTSIEYLMSRNAEVLVFSSQGISSDIYNATKSITSRYYQLHEQREQIDREYQLVGCYIPSQYLIFVKRNSTRYEAVTSILLTNGLSNCP